MNHINPEKALSKKHFCELFDQLPLNDEEQEQIKTEYWGVYKIFLSQNDVDPQTAWLATKNIFIIKEPQIGERVKKTMDK